MFFVDLLVLFVFIVHVNHFTFESISKNQIVINSKIITIFNFFKAIAIDKMVCFNYLQKKLQDFKFCHFLNNFGTLI